MARFNFIIRSPPPRPVLSCASRIGHRRSQAPTTMACQKRLPRRRIDQPIASPASFNGNKGVVRAAVEVLRTRRSGGSRSRTHWNSNHHLGTGVDTRYRVRIVQCSHWLRRSGVVEVMEMSPTARRSCSESNSARANGHCHPRRPRHRRG